MSDNIKVDSKAFSKGVDEVMTFAPLRRVYMALWRYCRIMARYQREKMHGAKPHIWEQHSGKLG